MRRWLQLQYYRSAERRQDDYDTIWTVKIDDQGNLTVDNDLCEGIDSTKLPETAPQF
jgi:hypothetical protein